VERALGWCSRLLFARPGKRAEPCFAAGPVRTKEIEDFNQIWEPMSAMGGWRGGIVRMDSPCRTLEMIRSAAARVFCTHPVALAYLYGSQATGHATSLSDIDVAVVMQKPLVPDERLRVELGLEVELASVLAGNYDVRIVNDAPLTVKAEAVQTGVLLFVQNEEARVDFEASTRDAYFDFLPVVRFHRQAYFDAQHTALKEKGLL
jgi:uncharacterized protein